MFILKKGYQPGVYVPLRALFLVLYLLCVGLAHEFYDLNYLSCLYLVIFSSDIRK